MAERIKLTPELLEDQAGKLLTNAEKNDNVINELDGVIKGLVAGWEGTAQRAFENSYNQKRATFESLTEAMRNFAAFLTRFADTMRGEEERQTSKAEGLAG